jgi:hypothetical protein
MIPNTESFKAVVFGAWLVESSLHEFPIFDLDTSTSPSTQAECYEKSPKFDFLFDTWLWSFSDKGFEESGESCTLSPRAIRAPLRSVRPDKRAELKAGMK